MKPTLNNIKLEIDRFIDSNKSFFNQIDFVIGVSRGGLIPAVLVSTKLNKPLIAAYINDKDEIFFDRSEWIENKKVLIVDDIVRSGKTMHLLQSYINEHSKPKTVLIYTPYAVTSMRDHNYEIIVSTTEVKDNVEFPWEYDK